MIITGFHAVEAFIKNNQTQGCFLYLAKDSGRHAKLKSFAEKRGVKVRKAKMSEIDSRTSDDGHKGVMLEAPDTSIKSNQISIDDLKERAARGGSLVLVLDEITDVHNLGAIYRSADQFTVDALIIPKDNAASSNETVQRISSGASQHVPTIIVNNLSRALDELKELGYWIYGADMGGTHAHKEKLSGNTVLVMGSEGKGMRRLVREKCDQIVSIPMNGHIDSLNVSVATGILLYEIRRQQNPEFF